MFVCHGNICRSPMAEFVMRRLLESENLSAVVEVASCATSSEEIGNPVYPPAREMLRRNGISCEGKRAVRLKSSDYQQYDLFVAMDASNLRGISRIFAGGDPEHKVMLLLDTEIDDPWYTGDFQTAYNEILAGCRVLLQQLLCPEAFFAGGCFWGMEYWLRRLEGVRDVICGYAGGEEQNPSYEQVKSHQTGHYECVRVLFDPAKICYRDLAKYFFEIHDPTQRDGQGIDVGPQYRSAVFFRNPLQKRICEGLVAQLAAMGYDVCTALLPYSSFYDAEQYHQRYCERHKIEPECHIYTKRF